MACEINLFEKLGGTPDTGGSWSQTSGPQAISLSGGHLGTADFCDAADGTYVFSYKFNDIDTPSTVSVTVGDPPDPGTSVSIDATEGDSAITLYDELGGSPDAGGSWAVSPSVPSGVFNAGAGTYDPASGDGSLNGTTYVFTYSVTKAGTDGDCDCCTKTATVSVTVYLGGSTGDNASVTVCNDD